MDKKPSPILHLLVGINGAGKTTFYYNQIKPRAQVPFINADEIQKQRWPDETNNPKRSYEAAKIAEKQRDKHIEEGKSFAAETVFSHPSKLDLIKNAQQDGFSVALYHIHVASPELATKRVENRTEMGGHHVPEEKIAARFSRTLAYLRDAVKIADRTMVYDNSEVGKSHRHLMTLERGTITNLKENLPEWAYQQYGSEITNFRDRTATADENRKSQATNVEDDSVKHGPYRDKAEAFKQLSPKELLGRYPDDKAIQDATVVHSVADKFAQKKISEDDRARFMENVRDRIADNLEHGRENVSLNIRESRSHENDDQER